MKNWLEDESFWVDVYDVMFNEGSFKQAQQQVKQIIALTANKGGAILDLCCGPGRYTIPLAKEGLYVSGVDISPYLLKKAALYAEREGVDVELINDSMKHFKREAFYETVISMFTSFGYYETENEDLLILRNIYHSLKPNGYCLIDVLGKEIWINRYIGNQTFTLPHLTISMDYEAIEDWNRIKNIWTVKRGSISKTYQFYNVVYSGLSLKKLLINAGFNNVRLYGAYDGSPYNHKATRLIAVGQR